MDRHEKRATGENSARERVRWQCVPEETKARRCHASRGEKGNRRRVELEMEVPEQQLKRVTQVTGKRRLERVGQDQANPGRKRGRLGSAPPQTAFPLSLESDQRGHWRGRPSGSLKQDPRRRGRSPE